MNVGTILGLDGDSELLDTARRSWSGWRGSDTRLDAVRGYDDLQGYLRRSSHEDADRCRLALATLAAADGGNELAAAAALAKSLLPGASVLAGRLTRMVGARRPAGSAGALVNELVASQLWIEVRSFPWKRLDKVGGNILMNIRAAVLYEVGDFGQLQRRDPAWARTRCVGDETLDALAVTQHHDEVWDTVMENFEQSGLPGDEVTVVLTWAQDRGVISEADRQLILALLEESSHVDVRGTTRGRGNLCSDALAARVAPLVGVAPSTVRRRASRSVQALMASVPSELCA